MGARTVKKMVSLVMAMLLLFSVFQAAFMAMGASASDVAMDTTAKRIPILMYDADSGEYVDYVSRDESGNVVRQVKYNELNLGSRSLLAKRHGKKTLFNQQEYLPEIASELYSLSYLTTTQETINAYYNGYDFRSTSTRPDTNSEGEDISYRLDTTPMFFVRANGEIVKRELKRVFKVVVTYKFETNNETGEEVLKGKTSTTSENYADQFIDTVLSASSVTLSTYTNATLGEAVQYVSKVGNTSATAMFRGSIATGSVFTDNNDEFLPVSTCNVGNAGYSAVGADITWQGSYASANTSFGKTNCYIDLGAYFVLTDLSFMTSTGNLNFGLAIGDPGNWQYVVQRRSGNTFAHGYAIHLGNLPQVDIEVPREYSYIYNGDVNYKNATRYVYIEGLSNNITEVLLYGYQVGGLTEYDQGKGGVSYYMAYDDNNADQSSLNFNNYDAATSTYTQGTLSKKLDTSNTATYDPHGYLQYVADNKTSITGEDSAGDTMGGNILYTTKLQELKNQGNVREFVSTWNIIDSQGKNRYQYFGSNNNGSYDSIYSDFKGLGIQINPCMQMCTQWFSNSTLYTGYENSRNWMPLEAEITAKTRDGNRYVAADAIPATNIRDDDAVNYTRHANFFYNYAARYGKNTDIDPQTLNLATNITQSSGATVDEEPIVGLDYVTAIESGNEQNKNWAGGFGYHSAWAYAAIMSADYDGHEDRLYMDESGNAFVISEYGVNPAVTLDGVTVGHMDGYSVVIDSNITMAEVEVYRDQYENHFNVYDDGTVWVNTVQVGTYVRVDETTITMTRNGNEVPLTKFDSTYKLRTGNGPAGDIGDFIAADVARYNETGRIDVDPTGVKNADANMKLATGGFLHGGMIQYLEQMKDWFAYNRSDGYMAFDIVNFHNYVSTSTYEDSPAQDELQAIVDWVYQYAPGRQIWLSEYNTESMDYSLCEAVEVYAGLDDAGNKTYSGSYEGDVRELTFGAPVYNYDENGLLNSIYYYSDTSNGDDDVRISIWGGYLTKQSRPDMLSGTDKYAAPYMSIQSVQNDNRIFELSKAQRLLRMNLILNYQKFDRLSMFWVPASLSGVYTNFGLVDGLGNRELVWYYVSLGRRLLKDAFIDRSKSTVETVSLQKISSAEDTETIVMSPSVTENTNAALNRFQFKSSIYSEHTKIVKNYYDMNHSGSDQIDIYKYRFDDRQTGEAIYAIWAGTDNQVVVDNYVLDLSEFDTLYGAGEYHATAITPAYGYEDGVPVNLPVLNGQATMQISETVTFVKITRNEYALDGTISNYDELASGKYIQPVQMQLGDTSLSKPRDVFDGSEIVDFVSYDENGNATKNDIYYEEDLKNIYTYGSAAAVDMEPILNRTQAITTLLGSTDEIYHAALQEAILQTSDTAAGLAAVNAFVLTTRQKADETNPWNAKQKQAVLTLATKTEQMYAVLQDVLDYTSASDVLAVKSILLEVRGYVAEMRQLVIDAKATGYGAYTTTNEADKLMNELMKIPVYSVLDAVENYREALSFAQSVMTMAQNGALAIKNNDAAQIEALRQQAGEAVLAAGVLGNKTTYTIQGVCVRLDQNNNDVKSAANRRTTILNQTDLTIKDYNSVVNSVGRKTINQAIQNLLLRLSSATQSVRHAANLQAGCADNILMTAAAGDASYYATVMSAVALYAEYLSHWSLSQAGILACAAEQVGTGIYYYETTDEGGNFVGKIVGGELPNVELVSDRLLSGFAHLFDDDVGNVPQYEWDLTYKYADPYGIEPRQIPLSYSSILSAYNNEFVVNGVREGYDVYITFDDYYIIDAIGFNAYYNGTQFAVYDISQGDDENAPLLFQSVVPPGWSMFSRGESYFRGDAFTEQGGTKTNKVKLVLLDSGSNMYEMAFYGKRAGNTGVQRTPEPGELNALRDRRVTLSLNSQRNDVSNGTMRASIPSGQAYTTLAMQDPPMTLPIYEDRMVTDDDGILHIYTFKGWYTNSACTEGNEFTENSQITASTTIFAKWIEVPPYDQILLDAGMLQGGNYNVVDEQFNVDVSYSKAYNGKAFVVDLQRVYNIQEVALRRGWGTAANVAIYASLTGADGTWVELYSATNTYYGSSHFAYPALDPELETDPDKHCYRYLKFDVSGNVSEIYAYGEPVELDGTGGFVSLKNEDGTYNIDDTFTVNFDTSFLTSTSSALVVSVDPIAGVGYNACVTLPQPPDLPGFTFDGWYTTKNYRSKYTDQTPVINNITLYGKWTQTQNYTLTFQADGETAGTQTNLTESHQLTTNNYYRRNETTGKQQITTQWYYDALMTQPVTEPFSITGDTTLYSSWADRIPLTAAMSSRPGWENAFDAQDDTKAPSVEGSGSSVGTGWNATMTLNLDINSEGKMFLIEKVVIVNSWNNRTVNLQVGDDVYAGLPITARKANVLNVNKVASSITFTFVDDMQMLELYVYGSEIVDVSLTAEEVGSSMSGTAALPAIATQGGQYAKGRSLPLVATENDDYYFVGWYDNTAQTYLSTALTYGDFVLNSDSDISAHFTYRPNVTVSVTAANGNVTAALTDRPAISVGRSQSGDVITFTTRYGYDLALTAVETDAYYFDGWYQAGALLHNAQVLSLNDISENKTLTASFELRAMHIVAAAVSPAGGGTVTGAGNYMYGNAASLTATPATGYDFVGWFDVSDTAYENPLGTELTYAIASVQNDVSVVAVFARQQKSITISCNDGTMGSVSGAGMFDYGSQVTLTATPNTGYHFVGWYDMADALLSTSVSYQIASLESDFNIKAVFAIDEYTVTLVAGQNGTLEGGETTLTNNYIYGTRVFLNAYPNEGYHFDGWYEDETLFSAPASYSFLATRSITLTAKFVRNTYTVTIGATEGGSVNETVNGSYLHGDSVTLIATAQDNYNFLGWYTSANVLVSSEATYTIPSISENVQLTAKFAIKTFTVAASSDGNGTVSGGGTFSIGSTVSVIAAPNAGFAFDGWYDGDTKVSTETTYTIASLQNNVSLQARFVAMQYTLTVTARTGGTVNDVGGQYNYNDDVTLIATPSLGYSFNGWYVGDTKVSDLTTYEIRVTQSVEYVARFTPSTWTVTVSATNGTVSGAGTYNYGSTVVLLATPDAGYEFAGWYENGELLNMSTIFTIGSLTENKTLEARFRVAAASAGTSVEIIASGNGIVKVNGEQIDGTRQDTGVAYGTKYTLQAQAAQGSKFLFWIDVETQRVLSFLTDYGFMVSGKTQISAVFQTSQEANDRYSVLFLDANEKLLNTYIYDANDPNAQPNYRDQAAPQRGGYVFTGWKPKGNLDENTIDLEAFDIQKNMILVAVYQLEEEAVHTVSLTDGTFDSGTGTTQQIPYNTRIMVHAADAPEGMQFAFWLKDGTDIVSYQQDYSFIVVQDVTLEAIYATVSVPAVPVVLMSAGLPNAQDQTVTFYTEWELPSTWTFIAAGVIWTTSETYDSFESAADFEIDMPGVNKRTSKIDGPIGQYQWTKTNVAQGDSIYARGYITYQTTDGETHTIYTNIRQGTVPAAQ